MTSPLTVAKSVSDRNYESTDAECQEKNPPEACNGSFQAAKKAQYALDISELKA